MSISTAIPLFLPLSLLFLACPPPCSSHQPQLPYRPHSSSSNASVTRSSFPPDFIFGTLTMAVKHEGAADTDGKSKSIWDVYAQINGTVFDDSTPGSSGDQYNRYKDDIELVVNIGMDAFRFSIAWTRILPDGTSGGVNEAAVAHYNNLINYVIEAGLEPHVTLWCVDHPQAIEDEYLGVLSARFIDDFVAYANVCFDLFGDRVKFWTTMDEPNDYATLGYASSESPPGRCTSGTLSEFGECTVGNSSTEPYIVGHHLLLAHAAVVKLYRETYQATQGGVIGISLWFKWYEPLSNTSKDLDAAKRAQDFYFGWFMDPLMYGQYPSSMRTLVGPRLPEFTEEEALSVRGSYDFIGLNAVTAIYATWNETQADFNTSGFDVNRTGYFHDMMVITTGYRDTEPIGQYVSHEFEVDWCMQRVVWYMQNFYNNPPMFIYEMGFGLFNNSIFDEYRVETFQVYYESLSQGIRKGANVKGVFAWSLIDGFEYVLGQNTTFGLYYVDENYNRIARLSAQWHKEFLSSSFNAALQ